MSESVSQRRRNSLVKFVDMVDEEVDFNVIDSDSDHSSGYPEEGQVHTSTSASASAMMDARSISTHSFTAASSGIGSHSHSRSFNHSRSHSHTSTSTSRKKSTIKEFINCANDGRRLDDQIIHQKESKSIFCLRLLTFSTLITAAVIVASLTFRFSRSAELTAFQTQYEDSVVKVEEAIAIAIRNKLKTAETFSAMYTSRYGPENVWPNVTMPDFQQQAAGQLEIADGIAISYNPIIKQGDDRNEFEAHANEAAVLLGADELVERSCDECRVVADGIYRVKNKTRIDDSGSSPESRYPDHMVPVWQIFPTKVNWRAVMFNLHSETNRQRALDDMLEYQVPAITALLHLVQHDEMNPSSILFYPVFDRFDIEASAITSASNPFFESERNIRGSISIVFTWEDILKRVLPSYIKGMIVVLESSVSEELPKQLWTYEVNGEDVRLLGEGDLHDMNYQEFEHSVKANVAQSELGLDIVDYLITYEIRLYPSEAFKQSYLTSRPAVTTAVVICIFILTSFIFLFYDYLVKNRQEQVMAFASKSGRIVNSLFPENVRDRLLDHADHMSNHRNSNKESSSLSKSKLRQSGSSLYSKGSKGSIKSVLRRSKRYSIDSSISGGALPNPLCSTREDEHAIINLVTPPIADLFSETSIMFADIVGFTSWCSQHSPEEVFHLLETLFYEFDALAEQMNIFKLGTIGDCYIAVTGIPDYRPDHAVVLCKFAEECLIRMKKVIKELNGALGGLNKLNMRFGIHSGPVTAGVLRGQKSRFELFGDTINTASRMESNGVPGMIQISKETADLLLDAGHDDWIKPRTSLVQAKGKGLLQTFWFSSMYELGSESLHTDTTPPFTTGFDTGLIKEEEAGLYHDEVDESPLHIVTSGNSAMSHHPYYQTESRSSEELILKSELNGEDGDDLSHSGSNSEGGSSIHSLNNHSDSNDENTDSSIHVKL